MAHTSLSDNVNDHVLLERHSSPDAPKVALLPHDMLPVRLWRHIVQRVRLIHDADIVRESPVVL